MNFIAVARFRKKEDRSRTIHSLPVSIKQIELSLAKKNSKEENSHIMQI
jgi:hypothetical protein